MAQYTMIPNETGGAVDDAYLYRLNDDDEGFPAFLLVIDASNKEKDWNWFLKYTKDFPQLNMTDKSDEIGMIALQGPFAKAVLDAYVKDSRMVLPDPWRNRLSQCNMDGVEVTASRTGYTGEPICFELFVPVANLVKVWERILELGKAYGLVACLAYNLAWV